MARPLRIQYPDAVYHVTCRGNEKQNIFRDDSDRSRFLQLLNQSVNIYTVKLHSYVLMNNHFHLLVETPLANLSEFMRHFNIAYIGYLKVGDVSGYRPQACPASAPYTKGGRICLQYL